VPPSATPEVEEYPWEQFVSWLDANAVARGTGGKAALAELLGVSRSNMSQILRRQSGFDRKTVALMSLIESSKAEHYEDLPVERTTAYNGLIIEARRLDGELIYTWRAA
jgi:hypothetical protein